MPKTAQLPSVRCDAELRAFLDRSAKSQNRSLSNLIETILEDYRNKQRMSPEEIEADEDRAAFLDTFAE